METSRSPGNYPILIAERIQNPNRVWAIPLLGIFVKWLLLIPLFFWFFVVELVVVVLVLVNSLVVLFTGSYWRPAYEWAVWFIRLTVKAGLYIAGLTDRYPGFGPQMPEGFTLDIEFPQSPSRFFAVPCLGGIARGVLLIPFAIYTYFVFYGAIVGAVIAFVPVLFAGTYPETVFELLRDSFRLQSAQLVYGFGLSDRYPSFAISMNHGGAKIALIAVGAILLIIQEASSLANSVPRR